jgi:hypothetical protein
MEDKVQKKTKQPHDTAHLSFHRGTKRWGAAVARKCGRGVQDRRDQSDPNKRPENRGDGKNDEKKRSERRPHRKEGGEREIREKTGEAGIKKGRSRD